MALCPHCSAELDETATCPSCQSASRPTPDASSDGGTKTFRPVRRRGVFRERIAAVLERIPSNKRHFWRLGALIAVGVLLITGLVTALCLSLRTVPTLDRPASEQTAFSDGVISVKPSYADGALLFEQQTTADLHLIVQNVSELPIHDLTLDYALPEGLVNTTDSPLTLDSLYPDASHSFTLAVQRITPTDEHFASSVCILLLTTLLILAGLSFFVLLPVNGRALLNTLVALLAVTALLLPQAAPVFAATDALTSERQLSHTFSLGQDAKASLSCHARYTTQQHLMVQARLSDDAAHLELQWNAVDDATAYHIYVTDNNGTEREAAVTEAANCTVPTPTVGTVASVRATASTPSGELQSATMRLIVNQNGRLFTDSDGDLLSDDAERSFGTSTVSADTDGDGLSDFDEITVTFTSPLTNDSDRNGIIDAEEDPDGDGLNHLEECQHATEPFYADSDRDGTNDSTELTLGTCDPLDADSDNDGMTDTLELTVGADPQKDDDERVYTGRFTADTDGVTLEATDRGLALSAVMIDDMSANTPFHDQVFVASPIIAVETAVTTEGTLTLPLTTVLDREDTIGVLVYNSDENDFRLAAGTALSADGRSVSVPLCAPYIREDTVDNAFGEPLRTHRALYLAVYMEAWSSRLTDSLSPTRSDTAFDVSFVIDESGSTEQGSKGQPSDPDRRRIEAAKQFTACLRDGDRASVIGFTSSARRKTALTDDMVKVRSAMDRLVGNGNGSALFKGLEEAVNELATADTDRGRFVIALTDGADTVQDDKAYDAIIDTCIEHRIPLYIIGLGNSYSTRLLTKLTSSTGGAFFRAQDSDELPAIFNRIEATAFYGGDTDGDGLSDAVEEHGLRDSIGMPFYTKSDTRFTDEDDLSDGEECGQVIRYELNEDTVLEYYTMKTSPTSADTDDDGIDDAEERVMNTLPWCSDTDNDGLSDGFELGIGYDPLRKNGDGDALDDWEEYTQGTSFGTIADHLSTLYNDAPDEAMVAAILAAVGCNDPYSVDLPLSQRGRAFLQGTLLGGFEETLSEAGLLSAHPTDTLCGELGKLVAEYFTFTDTASTLLDMTRRLLEGDTEAALLQIGGSLHPNDSLAAAAEELSLLLSRFADRDQGTASYSVFLLQALQRLEERTAQELLTDEIDGLLIDRMERGAEGLTKDAIDCWDTFVEGEELSPYKIAEILPIESIIPLSVSRNCTPLDLSRAVRRHFGNTAGGCVTETAGGDHYTLVRTIDLECAQYQDSTVLERALKDSVDRAAAYADPQHRELSKTLQLVLTDTFVSSSIYDDLQLFAQYATLRDIELEIHVYRTDDPQVAEDPFGVVTAGDNRSAIVFLPDLGDTDLLAGEDYVGPLLTAFQSGDSLWPSRPTETYDPTTALQDALSMLCLDADGRSVYRVSPEVIREQDRDRNAARLFEELQTQFGNDHDILVLTCDWRRSVRSTARELTTYLDRRGYESVSFVCHGTGGLLCAAYLAQTPSNLTRTSQVVTLGTPWDGTPSALTALENGMFFNHELDVARSTAVDAAFCDMAVNLPSVYELLPQQSAYLFNTETRLRYDAAQAEAYLRYSHNAINARMLNEAEALQTLLCSDGQHIMENDAIDCTMLVGINTPTPTTLLTDGERIHSIGYSSDGDGLVPLVSATEHHGKRFDTPLYLLNGVSHDDMLRDPEVIRLVVSLLDEDTDSAYSADNLLAVPSADAPLSVSEADAAPFDAPYTALIIDCPGSASLYDNNGQLVGTVSSSSIPSDARFARLDQGQLKQLVIPDGYAVSFLGEGSGAVDLTLIRYDRHGQPQSRTQYRDIPVTVSSRVSVSVRGEETTIRVDIDSDGGIDHTLGTADGETQYFVAPASESAFDARPVILIVWSVLLALAVAAFVPFILWRNRDIWLKK